MRRHSSKFTWTPVVLKESSTLSNKYRLILKGRELPDKGALVHLCWKQSYIHLSISVNSGVKAVKLQQRFLFPQQTFVISTLLTLSSQLRPLCLLPVPPCHFHFHSYSFLFFYLRSGGLSSQLLSFDFVVASIPPDSLKPIPLQDKMTENRDDLIYMAKLSEQAERFDDMVSSKCRIQVELELLLLFLFLFPLRVDSHSIA